MITKPKCSSSPNGAKSTIRSTALDPDEIRRLVRVGKERGLISAPGRLNHVEKNGLDATALGKVRSQWMDITPDKASSWLTNNIRNRAMREDTVKAYARDMLAGVWVPTHQGIAFNDRDELIDGQHRLQAIVLSGCTIHMMVTFGLPSAIAGKEMTTMDAVDRGATRSVADQLTIQHGFKNGSITASICAALASLCAGERTRRLSVGQTLEVFRAFESSVLFVIDHRSKAVGLRTTGVLAGVAFAHAVDAKSIAPMFERLNSGETLKAKSPLLKLREFLVSDEAKLFTRSLDRGLAELVLQALHLELLGKPAEKLGASTEGADYFRKLQIARVDKIAALFRLPTGERTPS